MSERKVSTRRISRIKRALKTAEVAEKGNLAAIDQDDGALVVAVVGTTLYPIGYFEESFTGDGTELMSVRLFADVELHLCGNATSGPVADDDVGNICYLENSFEVSMIATGKSIAGRVWEVETNAGVWVQMRHGS